MFGMEIVMSQRRKWQTNTPRVWGMLFLGLFIFGGLAPAGAQQNWPSFRGPEAKGIAEGYKMPVQWDVATSENILWRTELAGLGLSSPVVWGDRIFVTTAIDAKGPSGLKVGLYGNVESIEEDSVFTWRVYCVDKKSGKILWEKDAYVGKPKMKRHPKSSHANSTCATDGRHVVAFFTSEGLYCYDMAGELKWKKDLGVLDYGWYFQASAQWGGGSSPIIHDGMVILQCDVQKDSFLAAFDVTDGREIWRVTRNDVPTWSTPTVYDGEQYQQIIVNGYRHIGGYDIKTGKEIWKLTGGGDIPAPTPIVSGDLVFITNAHGSMAPIYAIKLSAKGDISLPEDQLTNESVVWSVRSGGNYMTTPIVYGAYLYGCANNGVLSCYEAATGKLIYKERLKMGAAFSGSPVGAEGKLYFPDEGGAIFVVRAGPEYELLAVNDMGEICMASPAISEGVLFLRTRSHLVAVTEH